MALWGFVNGGMKRQNLAGAFWLQECRFSQGAAEVNPGPLLAS